MSSRSTSGESNRYPTLDRSSVLRALVPAERRRVLSVLLDRPAPVDERTLAERVVADERGTAVAETTGEATSALLARLRQVHLPALDDAGLLTWYRSDGLVAPTGHPGLRDPLVHRVLQRSDADDVVDALADPRRRAVVAVLQRDLDRLSEDALADSIAVQDPGATAEDVAVSLRHVHLPKLDAAGLVDHDRESETVVYRGHSVVEGPWFGWSRDDRSGPQTPPDPPGDPRNHEHD